jgi:hypothetical protein
LPGTTSEAPKAERIYESYSTVPLEDRVRRLEKRHRISDTNRAWQNSWLRHIIVSTVIYVTASMLLAMILIPAWYVCALVPVFGYWLGGICLSQARIIWDTIPRKKS